MSSSFFHIELSLSALPNPFPHSQFSSVPVNFHLSWTHTSIDSQTSQTLASSSPNPSLHRPFQFHPQLLNSPALLSRTLYRFLTYCPDLAPHCQLTLADQIGHFISEQRPPLSQVDARIQVVRYEFVNPTPAFRFIDGMYVIDAVDVGREVAVKEFIKKRSYECGDERDEEECSICCENYRKERRAVKAECDHVFHPNCISKWLLNNNTCPLCRKSVY